jgi:hypothetical protein
MVQANSSVGHRAGARPSLSCAARDNNDNDDPRNDDPRNDDDDDDVHDDVGDDDVALRLSDIHLKRDIVRVGGWTTGYRSILPVTLERLRLCGCDGAGGLDYERLGTRMMTWDEWQRRHDVAEGGCLNAGSEGHREAPGVRLQSSGCRMRAI